MSRSWMLSVALLVTLPATTFWAAAFRVREEPASRNRLVETAVRTGGRPNFQLSCGVSLTSSSLARMARYEIPAWAGKLTTLRPSGALLMSHLITERASSVLAPRRQIQSFVRGTLPIVSNTNVAFAGAV